MPAAAISYAVSVHGFIDKIGSYLAFAAIIGVALLVIMFFVQARETSLLRERAEDAEEDLERLRQYAEQVARQAAAAAARPAAAPAPAQPTPAPAAAASASRVATSATVNGRSTPPSVPVAPVGVGAPALSSATRLIPLPEAAPVPAAPAPSTVAAGGEVAGPASTVTPPPALAPPTPPPATQPPRVPPSLSTSAGSAPSARAPRRDYGRAAESESRVGKAGLLVAAILVAVIVVAAVLVITHHSHHAASRAAQVTSTSRSSSKKGARGSKTTTTVQVNPRQVRVAVLNGTTTNNLAADVSTRLNKVGFQQGETANYAGQPQTTTTVGYLGGDRAQGLAVARALGLAPGSVKQVSNTALQSVCPSGGSACADQVVVTLGANLDSDAS